MLINSWLRPGALLLYRVPSGDSPFARASQHGDITHRITIGSSLAKQLALKHNYEIVCVKSPAFPILYGTIGSRLRRLFINIIQHMFAKFIQIIFHYNKPTVISSNMVVAMKRPLLLPRSN